MTRTQGKNGFSLVELLIVVAIIGLLSSILVPSLAGAKHFAQSANCLSALNALGRAMGQYHAENNEIFWPCTILNHPQFGTHTYFWGTNTDPVDPTASPFMAYCDYRLAYLWCPSQPWGDYVPQGGVRERTTNFGYNAWCLDPAAWGRSEGGKPMPAKRTIQLPNSSELFVFADSGMHWAPGGVDIFQNSTHLEPVTGPGVVQPTTQFRHRDKANALCADGHAASFGREGSEVYDSLYQLGFVGTSNVPHYDLQDY